MRCPRRCGISAKGTPKASSSPSSSSSWRAAGPRRFCEIVWLVRYRAVERCPDGTGAAVRQEQEPDRYRRNEGADRGGENEFGAVARAWRRTQVKKWPVAGMDDGAGTGAGCVVAKRDPGGQVEQRVDGELPLLGDGRDHLAAVPDEAGHIWDRHGCHGLPRAAEATGMSATISLSCTNPRRVAYRPAAGGHRRGGPTSCRRIPRCSAHWRERW
jgi:hypothetical protein